MNNTTTGRAPLRRPRDSRMLAGVASGLARHLDIDVAIVRIAFVVIAIVTQGVGVLAYIAAIFLIPEEATPESASSREPQAGGASVAGGGSTPESTVRSVTESRDPAVWVGIGLLAVGAVWLMTLPMRGGLGFGPGLSLGNELIWALLLIGIGVALWRRRDSAEGEQPTPPPPGFVDARPAPADASVHAPSQERIDARAWEPPPIPDPRPRSGLGKATLGVALLTAGVLWALQLAGVLFPTPGQIVSAALLVIGLGLLVGAVAGRARWLILVGLLLAPIVLASILLRPVGLGPFTSWDWPGTGGDLRYTPMSVAELDPEYRMAAGRLVVDLREIGGSDGAETSIQLGAGEIEVRLPADRAISLDARVGVGLVSVDGQEVGGLGVERTLNLGAEGGAPLDVEVELGVGRVLVAVDHFAVHDEELVEEFETP